MSKSNDISNAAPLAVNGDLAKLAAEAAEFTRKGQEAMAAILAMRDFGLARLSSQQTREWQQAVARVHPFIKAGGDPTHKTLGEFRAWYFKLSSVKGVVDKAEAKDCENAWNWDLRQGRIMLGLAEAKPKKVATPGTDGETTPQGAASAGDAVLAFTKYLHETMPALIASSPDKAACVSLSSAIGMLADSLDTYMSGRGYILDGSPEVIAEPVPVKVPMPAMWGKFFDQATGHIPAVSPAPVDLPIAA